MHRDSSENVVYIHIRPFSAVYILCILGFSVKMNQPITEKILFYSSSDWIDGLTHINMFIGNGVYAGEEVF